MITSNNCREFFLDGVLEVSLEFADEHYLQIPPYVPHIESLNIEEGINPFLRFSLSDDSSDFVVDSITVKNVPNRQECGVVYSFEATINISSGLNNIRELYNLAEGNDFNVVIKKASGAYVFCYSLDGASDISMQTSANATEESATLTIKTESLSDLIPLTL